ncbi:MAG TPA: cytochrome c oxidase subunit 3 [Rhodanobacteraceae bacterium]|nr:cytochrome c oxidase subunit 3 [Rhodanobacteraceae bacterium]
MNTRTLDHEHFKSPAGEVEKQFDNPLQQRDTATIGMWVFMATEIMFFGVLFAAYTILRTMHAAGFAEASRDTDLLLGSIETAVLLVSSITIMIGIRAVRLEQRRIGVAFIGLTVLLGCGFLFIHGLEYRADYFKHLIPGIDYHQSGPHWKIKELFYCMYYFITGFHSLHLFIGICVNAGMAIRVARGSYGEHDYTALELAGLYWHLVDMVWIFVFPLLYLIGRSG